jgi:hypothetical protein
MSAAIDRLVDRNVVVLLSTATARLALQKVQAAKPSFVIVQGSGDRYFSFPAQAWRAKVEAARADADLAHVLALDQAAPDTTQVITVASTPDEIAASLAGVDQPERGTITVIEDGRPIGVLTLAALRQLLPTAGRRARRAPPRIENGARRSLVRPPAPPSEPPPPRRRVTRGIPFPAPAASAPPPSTELLAEAVPPDIAAEALLEAAPPEIGAAALPGAAAPQTRTLQPKAEADFPPEVVAGEECALLVMVSTAAEAAGVALGEITVPSTVTELPMQVYVQAPGFTFAGPNMQELNVPVDGQEACVDFTLRALPINSPETKVDIRVRFKYGGKFIGQVTRQTVVKQNAAVAAKTTAAPPKASSLTLTVDSPPPDILIEVNRDPASSSKFAIYLHSNVAGRKYWQKPGGVLQLGDNQTAATYTEALFAAIQQLDPETAEIDLAGIGNTLWNKLPAEFQAEYWALLHDNPSVRAIQIISDEAYIPWELLKPVRVDAGKRVDAHFWGEAFAIGRWDPARTLPQPLVIQRSNVVVPDYPDPSMKLKYAQKEISVLQDHCDAQPVQGLRGEIVKLLGAGGWQLIHFACHGQYNGQNPDLSELLMEDKPLSAATIAAAAGGITADRPFVFLNACEVGQQGLALTHLGGWAEVFCSSGFSGFVGPLWEVDDEVAYEASDHFYRALKSGATLGEALQSVRQQWKTATGELRFNPTWLAYSLHCDPMLKVAFA